MSRKRLTTRCPVESTLNVISGRWKFLILFELCDAVKRFGALHRALGPITPKMLTQTLREMERDGLVERKVYAEVPPKVEYTLTKLGKSLKPVLDALHEWGATRLRRGEIAEVGAVADRVS